jgi:hypothetical protein
MNWDVPSSEDLIRQGPCMAIRTKIERISPLILGLFISGVLITILLVSETVGGRWNALLAEGEFDALARDPVGILRDVRIAIVHCLLMGYLPAAFLYVLQNGRRTVMVLQDALDCTPDECEELAASVRLSRRGLIVAGIIGVAISFLGPYLVKPVPDAPWDPSSWNPEIVWHRILGPLILMFSTWLGYAVVGVSLRMSRLAIRLRRIDLLDLSPLAPFTRFGLSNALLAIGVLSILSLMLIETGFGITMVVYGGPTLVIAALAFLAPVRGVHERIRLAKEEQLGRLNAAITSRGDAILSPQTDRQGGNLADLVAYRGLIESVPEWPFTSSTYARLALYLLIPLASWMIGVVAEEVVGRMLV